MVIHPESLVHAVACFHDGGMKAHIGPADMQHSIAYALHEEQRFKLPLKEVNLAEVGKLSFEKPDFEKYPSLKLGYEVVEQGGLAGAAFNAAKEEALDNFMSCNLSFPGMADVVRATLDELSSKNELDNEAELNAILEIDLLARSVAKEIINKF